MIQPIETVYKGYRFRSRLEARWGVFFDACGVRWEYEPEGFRSGDVYYLPDFLLHGVKIRGEYSVDGDLYVEVKPDAKLGLKPDELRKIEAVGYKSCVFHGPGYRVEESGIRIIVVDNIFRCASGEELEKHYDTMRDGGIFYVYTWIDGDRGYPAEIGLNSDGDLITSYRDGDVLLDYKKTEYALHRAKQARFEHGETQVPMSWKQSHHR